MIRTGFETGFLALTARPKLLGATQFASNINGWDFLEKAKKKLGKRPILCNCNHASKNVNTLLPEALITQEKLQVLHS